MLNSPSLTQAESFTRLLFAFNDHSGKVKPKVPTLNCLTYLRDGTIGPSHIIDNLNICFSFVCFKIIEDHNVDIITM